MTTRLASARFVFVRRFTGRGVGETQSEKVSWEQLRDRREDVRAECRAEAWRCSISVGTQDDRYEVGYGRSAPVRRVGWYTEFMLVRDPASIELRRKVGIELRNGFIGPTVR